MLKGHLGLDITSILLLEHFDFLEQIESNYSPLYIPQTVVPALLEVLLDYHKHDYERIEASQRIVELIQDRRVNIVELSVLDPEDIEFANKSEIDTDWLKHCYLAEKNNGYLVNFLPLKKRGLTTETVDLPPDMTKRLIDLRSILDALLEHRVITKNSYKSVIQKLGTTSESHTTIIPEKGSFL